MSEFGGFNFFQRVLAWHVAVPARRHAHQLAPETICCLNATSNRLHHHRGPSRSFQCCSAHSTHPFSLSIHPSGSSTNPFRSQGYQHHPDAILCLQGESTYVSDHGLARSTMDPQCDAYSLADQRGTIGDVAGTPLRTDVPETEKH